MRFYVDTSALITYYHEPTQPEAVWLDEFIGTHGSRGELLLSRLTILEYSAWLLAGLRRPRDDPRYLKPKRLRAAIERLEHDISPLGVFRRFDPDGGAAWMDRALSLVHEHRRRRIEVCDALHLASVLEHTGSSVGELGILTRDRALRDVCDGCRIYAAAPDRPLP
jgi:predicted nucleic acid-binding protein